MPEEEAPQVEETEELTEEQKRDRFVKKLLEALSKFEDAPTEEQITNWKGQYSNVLASAFDDDEVFIFRPLSRREHLAVKAEYAQKQQEAATILQKDPEAAVIPPTEDDFQQLVVDTCLLYASDKTALTEKAGSYGVLFEQILLHSNFMNPAMAAQFVIKL